ncbi:MAG: flavodoxin family protein [Anaerolineales bacterium]|jgi:multimeric flavodoxin WrbA|nr:flavodoxin family protein [Desulfobacteraceae bacterium]MCK4963202.1 flavodoxin family protein [Anaerolineales bacterium]
MKITVFNGSPRGKKGTTNVMVEEFLAGASEAGAGVENIFLVEKEIGHCLGCVACWVKTPGECVHNDDMGELIEKFMGSDVSVFATPIHIDNVSGIMKNFIDRLIPTRMPYFEVHSDGETRHLNRYEQQPKIMMISSCGYPEQSQFQVIRLWLKRFSRNFDMEVVGEIYRSWGWLIKAKDNELAPKIEAYKRLLGKAGFEVAENLKLSEETAAELEKPILPKEMHLKISNKRWDQAINLGKKVWMAKE